MSKEIRLPLSGPRGEILFLLAKHSELEVKEIIGSVPSTKGTVNPTLRILEEGDWLRSRTEPVEPGSKRIRRFYRLTLRGRLIVSFHHVLEAAPVE